MHGPLEVHLILLDNGRRKLLQKGCGSVLKCIDCGACTASLQKVAEQNGWKNMLLTVKNVALMAARGELEHTAGLEALEPFTCPVGITPEDMQKVML